MLPRHHGLSLFLLLLLAAGVCGCATSRTVSPASPLASTKPEWEKEVARFEAADARSKPTADGVLFVGSSSIRLWTNASARFPAFNVIRRGIGGCQVIDCLYFADRIVIPYQPQTIVFYAGGNDINAGKNPETVAADFAAFTSAVHRQLPRAEIIFISIAPNPARWAQVEKVRQANALVRAQAERSRRLHYLDTFSLMLNSAGLPRPELFGPDRLHMSSSGYELWEEALTPVLQRLARSQP